MTASIREWTLIANFHREGLKNAEKYLSDLKNGGILLTDAEMRDRVIRMSDNTSPLHGAWVKAVENGYLVENVRDILNSMYWDLASLVLRVPKKDSYNWQLLILRVIQELKGRGSFGPLKCEQTYDAFDDMAGESHDAVWETVTEILNKMMTTTK